MPSKVAFKSGIWGFQELRYTKKLTLESEDQNGVPSRLVWVDNGFPVRTIAGSSAQ